MSTPAAGRRAGNLYSPRPTWVEVNRGRPVAVENVAVEAIREEWLIEDRWWTRAPLRRHYYELVLVNGRNTVAYRDGGDPGGQGRWFLQRG